MRIVVAAVGKPGSGPVGRAVREFEGRAERYFDLENLEVASGESGVGPEAVRRAEGERILERLDGELTWFGLTRKGKGMSSRRLARYLGELGTYSRPGAAFILGGAHGLSEEVLSACRYRLALSPMTLPHELARLVLAEQLYRAGTILRGEPYHKGD